MFDLDPDKQGHLTLGALVGLILANYPGTALTAVLLVAFGKEAYDYLYNKITKTQTHGVEMGDAIATVVGGVGGIMIVHVIGVVLTYIGI